MVEQPLVELAIKNTFIEVVSDEALAPSARRRCSSAPPSPRGRRPGLGGEAKGGAAFSDASTASVGDACSSSGDEEACPSGISDGGSAGAGEQPACPATPDGSGRVTLCLQDTLLDLAGKVEAKRTELDSRAAAFDPGASPDAGVHGLLAAIRAALSEDPCVLSVHLVESAMGGISAITVTPGAWGDACRVLELAQGAVLEAAEGSEDAYVLGYAAQPFEAFGDAGFRAWIGRMPAECEATACWDFYQKGFCPRRATCRWCHPPASDLMQLVVTLQKPMLAG